MDRSKIIKAIKLGNIEWRKHALERMLERNISRKEVKETIKYGELIENYETDTFFESALFFYNNSKAIHVVAGFDKINQIIYIITAYRPDTFHFENDLKTRRTK